MEGEINKETSLGGSIDLNVHKVGSELIPRGVEEWHRAK